MQTCAFARLAREAGKRGMECLDAPVSGGDVGAREGTLAIMVGGERETFDRVYPLFQRMGKTIALMGGPGAGQIPGDTVTNLCLVSVNSSVSLTSSVTI